MLVYYFNIWINIENAQRGSTWRRFANNAPLSTKVFFTVLALCLFALLGTMALNRDDATNAQLLIVVSIIILSFFYSIIDNKRRRKSAPIDLGNAIKQVEPIRRKFMAQTSLTPDKLYFILEEARRFSSIRREDRRTFTGRAYEALVLGILTVSLVKVLELSGGSAESMAVTLFMAVGMLALVLMALAGPIWSLADMVNDIPSESLDSFMRDIELMILIERGCKPSKSLDFKNDLQHDYPQHLI